MDYYTVVVNTGALIMVEYQDVSNLYHAGLFFASYRSNNVVVLADPEGAFVAGTNGDSGALFVLFKAHNHATLYIKNRTPNAERFSVQVIHGMGN